MPGKKAAPAIVKRIRRLAERPAEVRTTGQAKSDLLAWNLTKDDICQAICRWIDANNVVREIVTRHAKGKVGKPAYVMKPRLLDSTWYVKVSIIEQGEPDGYVLIISAHPDH